MKTEHVTKVWEFYRDNCAGYKEPMRKQLRELDSYVDHLESLADDGEKAAEENEKLRLEVEQLEEERDEHFRRYDELEAENAKLRSELESVGTAAYLYGRGDLQAENAKLRELCVDFASMLTYAGLDGLRVEATIGGITKTYDASEMCDKVEEICDKED